MKIKTVKPMEYGKILDYAYKDNEWVAICVDGGGTRKVYQFDTYEQAESFLKGCICRIGIMTTAFYNNCIIN